MLRNNDVVPETEPTTDAPYGAAVSGENASGSNNGQNGVKKFGSAYRWFETIVMLAVLVLVGLLIYQAYLNIQNLRDKEQSVELDEDTSAGVILRRAEAAANSAEDTANELQTLLSFLEGIGVLVGLALGAAAYIGFRNSQDTRKELREETQDLHVSRKQFEEQIAKQKASFETLFSTVKTRQNEFEEKTNTSIATQQREYDALKKFLDGYRNDLITLPERLKMSQELQQDYSDLLIASQELRLNNYLEAHGAATRVLEHDKDNAPALYIAGWLELQYIDIANKKQEGIEKLKRIIELQPDWTTARAAYGVGLRRQARDTTDPLDRQELFIMAEKELIKALDASPHLLDLNLESFWGPVGGIRRETGRFDQAIEAYQGALKVTPISSYLQGNLAALMLKQATTDEERKKALDEFEKARHYASIKLAASPNDYYPVMDLAMSNTMLSQFDVALTTLDAALNMDVTRERLYTSLYAGWEFLYEGCPDDWIEVKQNLAIAVKRVKAAIEAREPQSQ